MWCRIGGVEKIGEYLREFWWIGLVGIVGLGILGYGMWGVVGGEEATVEIVKIDEQTNKLTNQQTSEIIVDVAGGVSKTLNLASEVKDGGKVYIPVLGSVAENPKSEILNPKQILNSKLININTASVAELDSLAGIGEVRAQAIIDNRPYGSTEELVSKANIPQSIYDKIKDSIAVY